MENWRERKNSSAFLSQRLTTTLIARIQKTLRSLFAHSIFELVIIVGRPSNGNDNLILQLGKEKKYHIISAARNDGRSLIRMTALFAPLSWHEALSNRRLPTRSTRFIPANTWWRSRHTDAIPRSSFFLIGRLRKKRLRSEKRKKKGGWLRKSAVEYIFLRPFVRGRKLKLVGSWFWWKRNGVSCIRNWHARNN